MQRRATASPGISPARRLLAALMGCAAVALVVNTWIVQGLFVPLVVSGGSMAPTLLGAHRRWQCAACGQAFACDLESLPPAGTSAVCPHCGAANDPELGADVPGDRVLVNRSAYLFRPPRRWERVVLRSPENPDLLVVKRVVGLPGEVVEIVGGDVFVDGALARKDPAAQRAMAVAVSDAGSSDRWRGDEATHWRHDDGSFVHDGRGERIDWLRYHHMEHAISGPKTSRSILDDSTYDQSESRRLNEVRDVMLGCELQAFGTGRVWLCIETRGDDYRARLDLASGELELVHNGRVARRLAGMGGILERPTRMEFAVAEGRVWLAAGGRMLVEYDYRPSPEASDRSQVLAVGSHSTRLRAGELRVLRDLYYTAGGSGQYRLGEQEYFLLGDNSPHSLDSRTWSPQGGVAEALLLGPALCW